MAAAPLSGGGAAARFAVRDLRAYLRGRWRCERSLADRGVAARFDGVARFSDGAAGTGTARLDYKEEGVVTMEGGGSSSATRAYTYTFPDGPAVAEVRSVPSARRGACKQVCPGWCVRLRPCACLRPSAYVRVRSLAFVRTRERGARPRVLLLALVASALELTLQRAFEQVLFEDGRFFHPLDLQSGEWQATHLCGDDVYEGAFAALSEDTWTMTWNVKGPRKDQTLRTRFLRESE